MQEKHELRKKMYQLPHGRSEFSSRSIKADYEIKKKINLPFDSIGHVQQIVQPKENKHQHKYTLISL